MIQQQVLFSEEIKTMIITSEAFKDHESIPKKYTGDGQNINPPLKLKNVPIETKSLVLIVEDPDAPIRTWVHWIVWNIPPTVKIKENSIPGTEGINDFREHHYVGPCPPSGTHHYHYKIYALDDLLYINDNATKEKAEKIMSSHIIAFGELTGTYSRSIKQNI
jgi:Raf kinase inhibitor-like YbhB/YbcL family protein